MSLNVSKWIVSGFIALSGLCFPIFAQPCDSISAACEHLAAACEELAGLYEQDCDSVYLPVEKCCCWGEFSFYAEYVWWHINQDQLHFAVTGVQNAVPAAGELFEFEGEWDSGFRIGAGIFFSANAWSLTVDWLCIHHDESKGVGQIPGGLTLRATRGHPADVGIIDSATADFDFKLDILRLILQVPLFTRTHVSVNPLVGLRGDRITEDFTIVYLGGEDGSFTNFFRYWGVGPDAGLEAVWYVLPTFSLFGEARIAGLYGNYDVQQTFIDPDADEDVNIRNRFDRLQAVVSSNIGVEWEGVFFKNLFLALRIAWETNYWFSLNRTYLFTDSVIEGSLVEQYGDLHTNGLTFRATISF